MLSFFKTILATLLGVFIAFFLLILIFVGAAASGSGPTEPYVRKNSVLKIPLSGPITERAPVDNPFAGVFESGTKNPVSIEGLRYVLTQAAADDRIRGVWLEATAAGGSFAILQEAHDLLTEFKESGKFVFASTTDAGMSEAGLYLATTADTIAVPAQSYVEFDGFYLSSTFYKRLFDRFGIQVEVINTGDYKTAAEELTSERFGKANREQLGAILTAAADHHLNAIGSKTGLTRGELETLLSSRPVFTAADAYQAGLVDTFLTPEQVEKHLAKRLATDKLNQVSYARYIHMQADEVETAGRIAVLHASGVIMPAGSPNLLDPGSSTLSATFIAKQLEEIAKDESVKAIVLRIDSPGGSASTSERIWELLKEAAAEKPLIASMGSVAASGGYYIAMAADTVVALPTTITGSIGVIMQKLSVRNLFENHIGITFDEIRSHPNASWMDPSNSLSTAQREMLRRSAVATYDVFKQRVHENRGLSVERVDELGQGRVWSGVDAHRNGLVDVLGGLDKAVAIAAEKAGLASYEVTHYPKAVPFWDRLMAGSMGANLQALMPDVFRVVAQAPNLSSRPEPLFLFTQTVEWN
jgi:protease IV